MEESDKIPFSISTAGKSWGLELIPVFQMGFKVGFRSSAETKTVWTRNLSKEFSWRFDYGSEAILFRLERTSKIIGTGISIRLDTSNCSSQRLEQAYKTTIVPQVVSSSGFSSSTHAHDFVKT